MDYRILVYGAKNSDSQIKNSPTPTESQFAKFNAHQFFPLYDIGGGKLCWHNFEINWYA